MINHSKPTIEADDIEAVLRQLKTSQLAQGDKVAEFEQTVAKYLGVKGGVALSSGTAALHMALLALGIKPGDEVIMPTYVCTALLNAVNYLGATAVIVDVEADSFNISFDSTKKKVTKATKAIVIPHMFGLPAEVEKFLEFQIPIIEDCAQSIGASINNKKVGSFADLTICSFYATKMIASGEGGMVLSDSVKLLDTIADLRAYDNRVDYKIRYNYKMSDMAAALGLRQIKKLDSFIQKRQNIASKYTKNLQIADVCLPADFVGKEHIYFRYIIKIKQNIKQIIASLKEAKIATAAPVFKPLHQYLGLDQKAYPVAEKLMKQALSIPIYPLLTQEDSDLIIKKLQEILSLS